MTESAQQALRIIISDYSNTTRFALACNDSEKIIEPIQSRCTMLRFSRLSQEEIKNRLLKVIEIEKIPYDESGLTALLNTSEGDMRYGLNNMQSTFVGFGKITEDNVYRVKYKINLTYHLTYLFRLLMFLNLNQLSIYSNNVKKVI